MNKKLLPMVIMLAALVITVQPVSAVLPGKSPLPPNSPFSTIWNLLQDLQNQISGPNGILSKITALQQAVTKETADRKGADDGILEALTFESHYRSEGDVYLQDQIDALQPNDQNFLIKMGYFNSVDSPPPAVRTIDVPSGYTHDQCRVMVSRYGGEIGFSIASVPTTVKLGAPYSESDGKFHPRIEIEDGTGVQSWGGQYLMVCQK